MTVYHKPQRTRAATWVPRRVYYVLAFLKRQLTPGTPRAISNKRIQDAIGFGSEGEVSQIMRYLSGEQPTAGRWAYGVLRDNPQRYRFIDRERMPSGGYLITLLATPEPIGLVAETPPQVVQLSFLDDPSVIPPVALSDAARGGSFSDRPVQVPDHPRPARQNARSQRDQHEETHEESDQEKELAHTPLFERLMAQPKMNRRLAQRIARSPIGTLPEFEADLQLAQTFAQTPFWFTVACWRDGQRVVAPEEPRHVDTARSYPHARTRRSAQTHQPSRSASDQAAPNTDYAALLAEIAACNPGMQV
jgi:hypothetical protein